jgi:hypothetical protein
VKANKAKAAGMFSKGEDGFVDSLFSTFVFAQPAQNGSAEEARALLVKAVGTSMYFASMQVTAKSLLRAILILEVFLDRTFEPLRTLTAGHMARNSTRRRRSLKVN